MSPPPYRTENKTTLIIDPVSKLFNRTLRRYMTRRTGAGDLKSIFMFSNPESVFLPPWAHLNDRRGQPRG
jgi:hypothetical protein